MELRFFNEYLKDGPDDGLAEATLFDTGSNTWDSFDTWPPANTVEAALYLQPDGAVSFSEPTVDAGYYEYVSDPANPVPYTEDVHLRRTREYMTDDQRFADRRPDVASFRTDPLTDAVTLSGPVEADLWVSTSGTDADFVVKIIDVFPNDLAAYPANEKNVPMAGYQMLVRGEVMRGRFRNSFEVPEPFEPGQPTHVRFSIPDVHHTFKPGHRIMIQVQNSWFPLVDRNPQTFVNVFEAQPEDFQKATQRIFHETGRPSRVRVRIRE
jgi:putative CocE/NonD family hydrolase